MRLRRAARAVRSAMTLGAAFALLVSAAAAQEAGLRGRVLDERNGVPVRGAVVTIWARGADAEPGSVRVTTDGRGRYAFSGLVPGRYRLTVEHDRYRVAPVEAVLGSGSSLVVSVVATPLPFRLEPVGVVVGAFAAPELAPVEPRADAGPSSRRGGRASAERERQRRFLSSDVRRLDRADLREIGTAVEEGDLFRALQREPGVARRDDFTADLWTRGSNAGQSTVLFDGIPLFGALHGLGVFSGVNSDMIGSVTFRSGVASASLGGGAGALVEIESRAGRGGEPLRSATLSPLSLRASAAGRAGRVAWAAGVRRSYVDILALDGGLSPGDGTVDYAFHDVTGRVDVDLGARMRLEASAFLQGDRKFGEVAALAPANEGGWGAGVARASLVAQLGGASMKHTVGVGTSDASVDEVDRAGVEPLHPSTENHARSLVWESEVVGGDPSAPSWSVGFRSVGEEQTYEGPGVDPARLLSRDQIARFGRPDLTPVLLGLGAAQLTETREAKRLSAWAERRLEVGGRLEVQVGLRAEWGSPLPDGRARLAPRLLARYREDGSPLSVSAGFGRTFQYAQSVGRTDVVRSGLRANEIRAHADSVTPAARSDLLTLGVERWIGPEWLVGVTSWQRRTDGILIPDPTPRAIEGPAGTVTAVGDARGIELSVRKLEGRVRGFVNYSLSRSVHRTGEFSFDAPEDQRHVGNVNVVGAVADAWRLGGHLRVGSGVPFTRVILVSGGCFGTLPCADAPPVLVGNASGQRGPSYASLDLHAEWSRSFGAYSLTVVGRVQNVLGRDNAVTYHSSCLCVTPSSTQATVDRFSRGLPRLPTLAVRVRF